MPYSNVPKDKWDEMDRCVRDVMDKDPKKTKDSAIAICHASIVGKDTEKAVWSTAFVNNLPDSSFAYVEPGDKDGEGKTVPRSKRHLPYKDKSGKVDPAHVRNALARLTQTNIPASAKASAKRKLLAAAKQVGIEAEGAKTIVVEMTKSKGEEVNNMKKDKELKKADEVEEVKPETDAEPEAEKAEEPVEEVKEETPEAEEAEAVEEVKPVEEAVTPEVKEEVVEVEEAEKVAKAEGDEETEAEEGEAEAKPDAENLTKVLDAITTLTEKVNELSDLVKRSSDEGAAATEDSPKEVKEEAPVEEVAKVDEVEPEPVKEEKAEVEPEVKKADTSSDADLVKELQDQLKTVSERLEKLEKAPAQSKVVVSKEFASREDAGAELKKVQDRLAEIEKIRDTAPHAYNEKLMDEALTLVGRKKELQGLV
jgi:hypothetical protein